MLVVPFVSYVISLQMDTQIQLLVDKTTWDDPGVSSGFTLLYSMGITSSVFLFRRIFMSLRVVSSRCMIRIQELCLDDDPPAFGDVESKILLELVRQVGIRPFMLLVTLFYNV